MSAPFMGSSRVEYVESEALEFRAESLVRWLP